MTLRFSAVLWTVLLVVGVFGLYMVKYKVREVKAEVAATERVLSEEKHNQHVLTAEWAYLNRPDRLRALSQKYLNVKPIKGQQIADFVSLPSKVSDVATKQEPHSDGIVKLVSTGASASEEDQLGDE